MHSKILTRITVPLFMLAAAAGCGEKAADTASLTPQCQTTIPDDVDGPITCACAPVTKLDQPVFGDGVYHPTSAICASAVHAGAIDAKAGGDVNIRRGEVCAFYAGAARHAVQSAPLDSPNDTKNSFWFKGFGEGACQPRPNDLAALAGDLRAIGQQAGDLKEALRDHDPALGAAMDQLDKNLAGSADGMKAAGEALRDDINNKLGGAADAALLALGGSALAEVPPRDAGDDSDMGAVQPTIRTALESDGDCPASFAAAQNEVVTCTCGKSGKSGRGDGGVYGNHPFTADSSICAAARVLGLVGDAGGPVTAKASPGCKYYGSIEDNGIVTRSWGEYHASFFFPAKRDTPKCASFDFRDGCPPTFLLVDSALASCKCDPNAAIGTVYGSGPYTADSSICAAAKHAGILKDTAVVVQVLAASGCSKYVASSVNGIETNAWGAYDRSFNFVQKPKACP